MTSTATHLVWTCYGTWLPGDDRGHWSALFDTYHHLRQRGHKLNLPDAITHQRASALMNEPVKILTEGEVALVGQTLGEYFTSGDASAFPRQAPGGGGYVRCYAGAIEPTHVHLLIGQVKEDMGKFVGRLKGCTSSKVCEVAGGVRRRTWTSGYWKVFLDDEEGFTQVRQYIIEHNRRRDLPDHPWPWITRAPFPHSPRLAGGNRKNTNRHHAKTQRTQL